MYSSSVDVPFQPPTKRYMANCLANCLVLLHAVCAAGYAGGNCAACPAGFWAAEAAQGTQNCIQCGPGLTTPDIASSSASNCTCKDSSQTGLVLLSLLTY